MTLVPAAVVVTVLTLALARSLARTARRTSSVAWLLLVDMRTEARKAT